MLDSEEYRERRNGKGYNTTIEHTKSENGSIEENIAGNSSENVKREVSENQTLTQEAVKEQIKGFIGPLTRQREQLTRLVQGMVTPPHPSYCLRTDFATTPGRATHNSDTSKEMKCFRTDRFKIPSHPPKFPHRRRQAILPFQRNRHGTGVNCLKEVSVNFSSLKLFSIHSPLTMTTRPNKLFQIHEKFTQINPNLKFGITK